MSDSVDSGEGEGWIRPGPLLLAIATAGAIVFFLPGLGELLDAWSVPQYSHGPLVPVVAALLFLIQLRTHPREQEPHPDRRPGVLLVLGALVLAIFGRVSGIADLVAYAVVLWVGGVVLVSLGWRAGRHFWPPVLFLVFMLPLPAVLHFKVTLWLQHLSTGLGVAFLRELSIPVFLGRNSVDLGVARLSLAESASGLRYLMAILAFSYVLATLYRGPAWHRAVFLLSAAPITALLTAINLAVAGLVAELFGLDAFHAFVRHSGGWEIFLLAVLLILALARVLLAFQAARPRLTDAVEHEIDGLAHQASRLRRLPASPALLAVTALMVAAALASTAARPRTADPIERQTFASFPRQIGPWRQDGPDREYGPEAATALAADDYHGATFMAPEAAAPVDVFLAWYADQSDGGLRAPVIGVSDGGWEIIGVERTNISADIGTSDPFRVNRVILRRGDTRMLIYAWFERKGRRLAWDVAVKWWLMLDSIVTGRKDGGLVRLTTEVLPSESDAAAEARLRAILRDLLDPLPDFIPGS